MKSDDELIRAMCELWIGNAHELGRVKMRQVLALVRAHDGDAERLRKGLNAVCELMNESAGVYGLHLNGDVSPWGELRTGGRFEEWLVDFDAAIDAARKDAR